MANYATLKAAIQQVIKTNGNKEITGALLQQSLLAMINSLGAGYQYMGIATPTTNPGTPDQNIFYIASTAGTYVNFGGLIVSDGEIAILKYNGNWDKETTGIASLEFAKEIKTLIEDEPENYSIGKFLNQYGQEVADDGYFISKKIPAVLGDSFIFSGTAKFMCTYTSSGVLCDFWSARTSLTISGSANTNAAYIVISFDINNLQTAFVSKNNVIIWRPQDTKGLASKVLEIQGLIEEHKSINLYNPDGAILVQDTYRYNEAILSGNESFIVISAKQRAISSSYVTNVIFIFENGGTQAAGEPTFVAGARYGLRYAVPSGAIKVSFSYRATYSQGVLLSEIMVTAGNSVPSVYVPYKSEYEFRAPFYDGVRNALYAPVYVATNGNDENNGDIDAPFFSIQRALFEGRPIIIRGGNYKISSNIDLSVSKANKIQISSYHGERVNLIRGRIITESDGTLVTGYTKVYAIPVSSAYDYSHKWIYQYGVDDIATIIPDNERTGIHKRKNYRCDFTAITKVASISDVENYDGFAFYYESGTLYISRPVQIDNSHFIFESESRLFVSASVHNRTIELDGIYLYGASMDFSETINSIARNCAAYGCYAGDGWRLDRARNLLLDNCEAARVEMLGSSPLGDGFSVHSDADSDKKAIRTSFELRNCWSHDNNNDGYSDHEGCEGFINGGLYEHNCIGGQGAGITPAYGAHDIIKDVICQFNNNHGFIYTGNGEDVQYETGEYGSVVVTSVVSRGNLGSGFVFQEQKQIGDFINCIAYQNSNYGFRATNGIMRCVNTLSVDNGAGNYSGVVLIGNND